MEADLKNLWAKTLDIIKSELSEVSFNTWIKSCEPISISTDTIKISVPNSFTQDILDKRYKDLVANSIKAVCSKLYKIEFIIVSDLDEKEETHKVPSNKSSKSIIVNDEMSSTLNPKYTFDSFVIGNSNRFAHAASLAVAESPAKAYNPLFIYGGVGLGKTHLMHAIGNYISKNSDKKVLYVTSEQFVSDFIGINKKDENGTNFTYVDFFKQKYRNIDVLIIDDIQYLGGATETQKEFFHTFNTLYGDNKQIIISSDRSPDDLKILEDRLRTRFCWGLPVDIYPPDFELRVAILKKRIVGEAINKEIPDQVIEYMASNLGSDIRQLEGAVTRLVAYSTIMGSEIDLNLAIEALKDYINKGVSEKNNVNKIQKVVAEYFQISVEDLKSKKRNSNISFPRQIAMFLCRKFTDESFPKIGIEFGGKDHSTVMHSCEKIEREIKTNKDLADTIDKLEKDIH